jgi:RNA polymerase sigma factor (sigma-70 family)
MPAFIRTKADEARWRRAKRAVERARNKSEAFFSNQDWALVNSIYQKMTKSLIDSVQEKLVQIAEHLKKGHPEDEEDFESQGFQIIDPDDELTDDEADKWLKEHGHQRPSEDHEEYGPDEDEEHQKTHREEALASAPKTRFPEVTAETLKHLREYTRPWAEAARQTGMLAAEADKNPLQHHEANIITARHKHYASKDAAYKALISSKAYQEADPITQMEMDTKFHQDWHAKNPQHTHIAVRDLHVADASKDESRQAHAEAKKQSLLHMLRGGHHEGATTTVHGIQEAGGLLSDEGSHSTGAIIHDPQAHFANMNREYMAHLQERLGNINPARATGASHSESMGTNEDKNSVRRAILENIKKLPEETRQQANQFFTAHMPLIESSARRVIKQLGVSGVEPGDLSEAGIHGLFHAINSFDPNHPSKTNFASYAGHKIRGAMRQELNRRQQIPQHIKSEAKKLQQVHAYRQAAEAQSKTPASGTIFPHSVIEATTHPKKAEMAQRLSALRSKKPE